VADLGAIVALAVRAENDADQLLQERARLGSSAGQMRWKSTAAASFNSRAQDGADMLARDAQRLDDVAAALRRHVRQVEEHLQMLADLARTAEHLAATALDAVNDAGASAVKVVAAGATTTVHAAEAAEGWVGDHVPW
jgi:hypothetical protein